MGFVKWLAFEPKMNKPNKPNEAEHRWTFDNDTRTQNDSKGWEAQDVIKTTIKKSC